MHKFLPILLLPVLLVACSGSSDEPDASPVPAESGTAPTAPVAAPATPQSSPAPAGVHSVGNVEESAPESAPATASSSQAADAAMDDSAAGNKAEETPAVVENAPPPVAAAIENGKWVEGKNYFLLQPQQPRLNTSDKVEVVEVFSYGCPACYHSQPFMIKLAKSLPAYAEMEYLPVAFRPDENFPLYQRAFYTAQVFGVARKAHDDMFNAVWKSGEIGTYDIKSGRPKPHDEWPSIKDIAKFYAQYGVDPKQFVATSESFAINTKMRRADQMIKNWMVTGTPSIVIDGKYRYSASSAGGYGQMLEMTEWLVNKQHQAMQSGQ